MKVREIDFDELSSKYANHVRNIIIKFADAYATFEFDDFIKAHTFCRVHGYLDRECRFEKYVSPFCDDVKVVITISYSQLRMLPVYPNNNPETTNEERKMKVKEFDFKKLQKENDGYSISILLTFDEETQCRAKQFDSFTAVENYLKNHPRWFDYSESDFEFKREEAWNNLARRVVKHYSLTIKLKKKDTPKVPYYQFCNGNVCNVNGKTYAPEIKDVIFNPPATIVKWTDGTKSVVKADNSEAYDPEKGLAMAIARKMYGNKYDYYNVFKKWLKKFDDNAAKKALAKVAKSVVDAWDTEPVSNGFRELEETDIKLKQLTGYDSKELLDLFAEGFTLVKECDLISEENKELVNCKDCAHFAPLPSNDPWEDDGVCELDGKGTYGMNSCEKAESKETNN